MLIDREGITALDRRQRAALINSITGFKPAVLVGTADDTGRTNLAIMSSLVHVGSSPPLLALFLRPDSAERHSLSNIRALGEYTINHVNPSIIDQAHQTAAKYPREISEFRATGLTEHWQDGCRAPFVTESIVRMSLVLREEQQLLNSTHLVVGEIQLIELPEDTLKQDGALDLTRTGSVTLSGLDSYYAATLIQRMAYADPDSPPRRLTEND